MAVVLGINAKTYYTPLLNPATGAPWNVPTPTNPFPATGLPTDAANAAQVMVELTNLRTLNLNLEKNVADITVRGGNGWRLRTGVLKDGQVTFQMIWDTADKSFQNIQYAFINDKHIYLAVLDGDATVTTDGTRVQGLYSPFTVMNMTRNEDLEEALMADVTMAPTFVTEFPPQWVDRTEVP